MSLPTDDEIRAVAKELGLLDERGQVPREKRTQLAAVAMRMRDVPDEGSELKLELQTTAEALARFRRDLADASVPNDVADAIVVAAVPTVINLQGALVLSDPDPEENRTP